jgi:hypothetical protein
MNSDKQNRCAHPPCRCVTVNGDKHCGPACREATAPGTKNTCQCGHATCPASAQDISPTGEATPNTESDFRKIA